MRTQNPFTITLRVYVEDTDYGGVVYHANHLKFMERARTELLIDRGYTLSDIEQQGCLIVIFKAQVDYVKPIKLNQLLQVSAVVTHVGNSSITFNQTISDPKNHDCIYSHGEFKVVCVDKIQHRPMRIPPPLREALQ